MSDTETVLSRDIARDQLVAELRALRPAFERLAVTHMALVGSRARQDNRDDSDIDLMIEVDPSQKFSLVEMARIMREVEERIGLSAHILMRRSLRPDLLAAAAADEIRLF
jgi:predicted nucleotidyltransferase